MFRHMLHREMTRKEFLSIVMAFFGLTLLNRLPFTRGGKYHTVQAPDTYGNNVYGGGNN
jgi:hypothetical protein